jgi:hypothetical protein
MVLRLRIGPQADVGQAEPQPVIEPVGARPDRLGIVLAELEGIHQELADPEALVIESEHLGEKMGRVATPELLEQVDPDFAPAEEGPGPQATEPGSGGDETVGLDRQAAWEETTSATSYSRSSWKVAWPDWAQVTGLLHAAAARAPGVSIRQDPARPTGRGGSASTSSLIPVKRVAPEDGAGWEPSNRESGLPPPDLETTVRTTVPEVGRQAMSTRSSIQPRPLTSEARRFHSRWMIR